MENKKNLDDDLKYKDALFCCSHEKPIDRRLLKFFFQVLFLMIILLWSIYETSSSDTCEERLTFIGILTTVVGILIPQPSL